MLRITGHGTTAVSSRSTTSPYKRVEPVVHVLDEHAKHLAEVGFQFLHRPDVEVLGFHHGAVFG